MLWLMNQVSVLPYKEFKYLFIFIHWWMLKVDRNMFYSDGMEGNFSLLRVNTLAANVFFQPPDLLS